MNQGRMTSLPVHRPEQEWGTIQRENTQGRPSPILSAVEPPVHQLSPLFGALLYKHINSHKEMAWLPKNRKPNTSKQTKKHNNNTHRWQVQFPIKKRQIHSLPSGTSLWDQHTNMGSNIQAIWKEGLEIDNPWPDCIYILGSIGDMRGCRGKGYNCT
jgi:hypothetical protein